MHVIDSAKLIADSLDKDPVMARQIQEHLGRERLLELLDIEPEVMPLDELLEEVDTDDLIEELRRRLK